MRALMYSLLALCLLAVGAVGGYFYGLTVGQTQATAIRDNFLQSRGIGAGANGAAGAAGAAASGAAGGQGAAAFGGFGGGQGTFGSVKSVEGNTIELSTAQAAVKVTVNDQTTVQQTVPQAVPLNQLQPGTNVMVVGDRDAQGNMTARSINVLPQGTPGRRADGAPLSAEGGTPGARRPGAEGGTPGARRQGTPGAATPAP